MNGLYPLGGLLAAAAAFYITTRILLRRELDRQDYRDETAARMKAAGWRTHSNVVYLDAAGGYAYKTEQPEGGGSDGQAQLGLVTRGSLAGGKGVPSGPPCKYCGERGGHTGQCPVVSTSEGGTSA